MSWSLEGMFIKQRYEVQRHIATGGMAAVFLGWDYRIERPVAIKVLRQLEAASEHDIARFQREARAAALLDDPHVVQVYDFFEENGCYFLVMEYVAGTNLKRYLRERGPLAADEAFALGEQVCAALEAAHGCGFIHRDIKPQNILLDAEGTAKLADFGIVHLMREARLTTSGAVLGTADYIAPEQARGEILTPASDLYAVGVVLYEMLTGRLLFTGRTPLAVATQHATAPVVPPGCYVPDLSPYIEAVVMRALHKQPESRYQTAARMGLALRLAREAVARTEERAVESHNAESKVDGEEVRLAQASARQTHEEREERAARIAVLADAVTAQAVALKSRQTGGGVNAARTIHGAACTPVVDDRHKNAYTPIVCDRGEQALSSAADDRDSAETRARVAWLDVDGEPARVLAEGGLAADAVGEPVELADRVVPDVAATATAALRWSRLSVTGLTMLALFALILLLGIWLHTHIMLI